MDLYEVLLVGHILGVVVMAFGTGAGMLAAVAGGASADLQTIARSARLGMLGGRVTSLAAVVVLLLGVWLVIEGDAWEFEQAWISAAFVLWIIAMALGGGVMMRHERRVAEGAEAALARGETSNAEVLADWNAPITKITGSVLLLLYVAFVYLMVAKPGV